MAEEQAASQQNPQQQFAMQRIYSKDVSFESPATPGIFGKQWQPKVNVDLNTKSDKFDDKGNFEVVLTITITAKVDEETAFLVEIQQAGIFLVTGFSDNDLRRVLGTAAPTILFHGLAQHLAEQPLEHGVGQRPHRQLLDVAGNLHLELDVAALQEVRLELPHGLAEALVRRQALKAS